jgi:hypothetical protein
MGTNDFWDSTYSPQHLVIYAPFWGGDAVIGGSA